MRRVIRRLGSGLALCILSATALRAQTPTTATTSVPRVIRVNGTLRLASGSPAPVEIVTFAIYAEETGGEPVWQETQNVVVIGDSQYSALLGATLPDGLPLDVFTAKEARWLEVHVERSGEPTSPRVLLASVPFALRASDAETLGGKPVSAFLLAEPTFSGQPSGARSKTSTKSARPWTTFNATQGWIPVAVDSAGGLVNSQMFQLGPGPFSRIGMGTASPQDYFHVSFDDPFGAYTGLAVQNRNGSANASSGMLFYDQNGTLAQFQGFSNATHEYRINNVAPGGSINFLIGNSSKFLVANSGDISISGSLMKGGARLLHTAGQSTFLGFQSGVATLPDASNTGFGWVTLNANTSGGFNSAFGRRALASNTTGNGNTAIGDNALGGNIVGLLNTAVGAAALPVNVSGTGNTAVGGQALQNTDASNNNTAVGALALRDNTAGCCNTALGTSAGANATTGSSNIYIGFDVNGVAGESNTIYLGKVGAQTKTFIAGVRGIATGVADAVSVVIDSAGQLGTINSSRRYKEDIQDMADASSNLMKLRPVTFRYRQPYADGRKPVDYGLIAEEVEEVFPDLVAHLANGEVETVQYHKINAMLLNELQKQHAALEQQRAEMATLKARLEALERERR